VATDNPLLQPLGVPAYDRIQAAHVAPAIRQLLAEADAALKQAVDDAVPLDYDAVSRILDVPIERLARAWSAVTHLNEVADTPALRAAYNDALPLVTAFHTRLGADERLYRKYRRIATTAHAPARQRALQNTLRDFVLGGAELQGPARERFAQVQARAAELRQRFAENLLDATDRFSHLASPAEMAGAPEDLLLATRVDGGHRLTLHEPCYFPLMQTAQDRGLRERLYRAYITRASDLGETQLDNTAVMRELIELRHEQARLLGYANYAELSLVPKMADSPTHVRHFLDDLVRHARPFAERELAELRDFAARELALPELQPWDLDFASERLKQARHAFASSELRPYFTEPRVLEGLFQIAQTLFEVEISAEHAPVWHAEVRHFTVRRGGAPIGHFYLDLHARAGKRSGAWMDDAQQRWRRPDHGALQLPVALLVCNFAPPLRQGGQLRPALLSHDEVITLFHEFGHGLHHLLTQVDELAVSGIAGVEWDAVELPSQFMENFCWQWDVLRRLSAHVDSGEPLPRELFDKLLGAKNFHSGLRMLRHMEYALFDLRIHSETDAASRLAQVAEQVHERVALMPAAPFNRFAHSFSHIFDGAYGAGFYSYSWAEVLSADVWSAFEEAGMFDPETGRRYLQNILEVGGSRSAMDNFMAFRGREPRIDALLRQQGMA
jgi:oligopeptidase A